MESNQEGIERYAISPEDWVKVGGYPEHVGAALRYMMEGLNRPQPEKRLPDAPDRRIAWRVSMTDVSSRPDAQFVGDIGESINNLCKELSWQLAEPFLKSAIFYFNKVIKAGGLQTYFTEGGIQFTLSDEDYELISVDFISFEQIISTSMYSRNGQVSEPDRELIIETLEKALAFARSYNGGQ